MCNIYKPETPQPLRETKRGDSKDHSILILPAAYQHSC